MAIDLVAIRNLLLPGINTTTGKYKELPDDWAGVFKTRNAKYTQERAQSVRYLGPARAKAELGSVHYDNDGGQRYEYTMKPITAGIAYVISSEALEDNQYQRDFNGNNLGLMRSMKAFWAAQAADVLNSATTYDSSVGGDGKALLATDHPNDDGTWANTHTTARALNEASLLSAIKLTRAFKDEAGILINCDADRLVIPYQLEEVAIRLLKTTLRPGTANNDTNAITKMGLTDYQVMRYLTGAFRWFLKTDVEGLVHWQRRKFTPDIDTDFDTGALKVKATERAGFFCYDPRAVVGEDVTA